MTGRAMSIGKHNSLRMNDFRLIPVVLAFNFGFSLFLGAQDALSYLGQDPPGEIPEKFAPGLISLPGQYEFGAVFSEDGHEFFFGVDLGPRSEIRQVRVEDGQWGPIETIIAHEDYGFNDPFLSPDGNRLFYISNRPFNGKDEAKDHDIWYSIRREEGWSAPINAGPMINSMQNEYYMSFTRDGTMYFASNIGAEQDRPGNYDLYAAAADHSRFRRPERLPQTVNTGEYEADVFISPDENYLIFSSIRPEGLGEGDLYISFRTPEGGWATAKNMGEVINGEHHELCPFVTSDGKYLFFTSDRDIYWVDAAIIESYR